jgi:hypothetical protein
LANLKSLPFIFPILRNYTSIAWKRARQNSGQSHKDYGSGNTIDGQIDVVRITDAGPPQEKDDHFEGPAFKERLQLISVH